VQPCTVTWWVIEQNSPMIVGWSYAMWTITKSCRFVMRPISIRSHSARNTALCQIETSGPIWIAP